MRDFSNNRINMLEWSAKKLFERDLKSNAGKTVTIDDVNDIRVIIQEHTNPLNEQKEDRKMLVPNTVAIHTGSITNIGDETWMIINKISDLDDNGVYYVTKILPCNTALKYISPSDNLTIREIPAIMSNMSLYSIGTEENKYFISEDGKRLITIPMNEITKEIYIGQRFVLGLNVFKITEIYDGNIGIYELKLEQSDTLPNDDIKGGIAYNESQSTNTNTLIAPSNPKGFW